VIVRYRCRRCPRATAGLEEIGPAVVYSQRSWPVVRLMAYTLWSSLPDVDDAPSQTGLENTLPPVLVFSSGAGRWCG